MTSHTQKHKELPVFPSVFCQCFRLNSCVTSVASTSPRSAAVRSTSSQISIHSVTEASHRFKDKHRTHGSRADITVAWEERPRTRPDRQVHFRLKTPDMERLASGLFLRVQPDGGALSWQAALLFINLSKAERQTPVKQLKNVNRLGSETAPSDTKHASSFRAAVLFALHELSLI